MPDEGYKAKTSNSLINFTYLFIHFIIYVNITLSNPIF